MYPLSWHVSESLDPHSTPRSRRLDKSPELLYCRASTLPLGHSTCVPAWHTGFYLEPNSVPSSTRWLLVYGLDFSIQRGNFSPCNWWDLLDTDFEFPSMVFSRTFKHWTPLSSWSLQGATPLLKIILPFVSEIVCSNVARYS